MCILAGLIEVYCGITLKLAKIIFQLAKLFNVLQVVFKQSKVIIPGG